MLHAVVLAGGSGTRFWPASRRARPKQLLAIGPGSDEALIAAAVRRIAPLCTPERTWIATGAHLVGATQRALPALPATQFLGEPAARNTAPCIGWATSVILRHDPDAVVLVLPSDQHIADEAAYLATVRSAVATAERGPITTIGLTPTRPETGYGYIEAGAALDGAARGVVRFVEKPSRETAEDYVASGRFLWNAGMFVFRASVMRAAIEQHLPDLARLLDAVEVAARSGADAEAKATAELFRAAPSVSIDHGVMEHMTSLAVVPGDFGWSDLGSWETAWELAPKDAAGNVAPATAVLADARDNLVCDLGAQRRAVSLVGVHDLCVVVTDDAVLVIPRERAQDVRLVVDALRQRGDEALT